MNRIQKLGIFAAILFVCFILAWILGGSPFVAVNKGYVGVKTRFGKVVGEHLTPGLQWKTPFIESITEINTQQDNATEHSQAASKDLQKVDTDVKLLYSLDPKLVPKAYDRIGGRDEIERKIITPAIKEVFKAVNAGYTAEQLITQRQLVSTEIEEGLNVFISKSCEHEGLDGLIRLDNVAIEDFRFSAQFDDSIEAKQIAEQTALRAVEEKQEKITKAEGDKEQTRLISEANALQIENEGRAEAAKITLISEAKAAAIEREAKALKDNPDLLMLRQIEQWDGVLPQIKAGESNGFLLSPKLGE